MMKNNIVFLIQTEDQKGLVAHITNFFYQRGFNILSCQQHTDPRVKKYFMRLALDISDLTESRQSLLQAFEHFAQDYSLVWSAFFGTNTPRMAIMVSKAAHCLHDLLIRKQEGDLNCDIPLIISNHPTLEHIAKQHRIPFYCLPVNANKQEQEQQVIELLHKHHIDVVILARYMQILSPEFIDAFRGRLINIHHAFLPAFQGANPYLRAYERGVKMIGATAHYATEDLDQGPIIEQDVVRVNHELTPSGLKHVGKDVERLVLFRAVQAHLQNRVLISGNRTVVFPSNDS
ncbi:MAG: formyltetrahydrofolate deformylase [Spirochaetota bacterium]